MSTKGSSSLFRTTLLAYASVVLMVLAVTALGKALKPPFDLINIILFYLLPVLASAVWWGLWPSVAASFLGVLAFDFFFVPPVMSFSVAHVRYLLDFVLFVAVALVTGGLAARLRTEAQAARERERRTAALYSFSQRVSGLGRDDVLRLAVDMVASSFGGEAGVLLSGPPYNSLTLSAYSGTAAPVLSNHEKDAARLSFERGHPMVVQDEASEGSRSLLVPIADDEGSLGVMLVRLQTGKEITSGIEKDIEAFMTVTAFALTKARLSAEAEQAKWFAESEKLHKALLSAVSHDLRTPLSAIMGAVTGLLSQGSLYDAGSRATLLETIRDGAQRMNRFITNLLDMARLESGVLRARREWCDLVDIIGVALKEVEDLLPEARLKLDCPETLPLLEADAGLIQQVVINLLENAAKYTSPGSVVAIAVTVHPGEVRVAVRDEAPVVPVEDRERIFDKFFRLRSSKHLTGTGLGLSICKGIVESHGGRIWVEPNNGNGNAFVFALPLSPDSPPSVESEREDCDGR